MERRSIAQRPDWMEKVTSVGLNYHTINDELYWDERACYAFTASQIDRLEEATAELHGMCLKAVDHVIRYNLFNDLHIPPAFVPLIQQSWKEQEPTMYGRFDFSWDGSGDPKLLEYNADTPTSLLEASVVQWFWLKDVFPEFDQFNSIHEKLLQFWKDREFSETVHFSCVRENDEDLGNVEYVRDVAFQAGYKTKHVYVEDIGWMDRSGKFVDLDEEPIETIFKLYPWEWLFDEEFGIHLAGRPWKVIEPPWKIIVSNKGILPLLWKMYPDHPNLLPAYFENVFGDNYVQKPFFSREGDSISIMKDGTWFERPGTYGSEGFVYQQYHPLPRFSGNWTSVGSWVIDGQPAGMGIREDHTEITSNTGRFIPHYFKED